MKLSNKDVNPISHSTNYYLREHFFSEEIQYRMSENPRLMMEYFVKFLRTLKCYKDLKGEKIIYNSAQLNIKAGFLKKGNLKNCITI